MAEIYLPGWVGGWVGGWLGLTLIIRLSLSSNWTELDWTGTELGNKKIFQVVDRPGKCSKDRCLAEKTTMVVCLCK